MFRFMRDGEPEDPMFTMDPFAIHRQHMNRMLSGGFAYSPFLSITDGTMPGARQASRRMQAGAISPFGMLGMVRLQFLCAALGPSPKCNIQIYSSPTDHFIPKFFMCSTYSAVLQCSHL
ncbi:killer cell lectin-like receptor subfamily F member 1 [Platysternon megacephalum]|uniref:Killer cell lectin-like receptor subfamily F member 1 n=1 Tax=Platysternon megacephalum TaxID=55544 RepID=A0A4D9E3C3_9SAUR|nr:killer cell lectin-like receptor subfamily F member 1 [Platysternon megacephalum]